MDAVSRLYPGVLHNDESSQVESMQDNLLEYPQYTRPEVWHGKAVPALLLSGDHAKIEAWRHEQSVNRTKERRPDLFQKSYRVSVVYFGSEENTKRAEELAALSSNYPVLYDYNRRKLQRQKLRFGAKDLVVVVTDKPKEYEPVFAKISADGSLLIIAGTLLSDDLSETAADQTLESMEIYLHNRGFSPQGRFAGRDAVSEAAEAVRRKTNI